MYKSLILLFFLSIFAGLGGCQSVPIQGAVTIGTDPDDGDGPGLFTGKTGGIIIYKNPSEADDGSD